MNCNGPKTETALDFFGDESERFVQPTIRNPMWTYKRHRPYDDSEPIYLACHIGLALLDDLRRQSNATNTKFGFKAWLIRLSIQLCPLWTMKRGFHNGWEINITKLTKHWCNLIKIGIICLVRNESSSGHWRVQIQTIIQPQNLS